MGKPSKPDGPSRTKATYKASKDFTRRSSEQEKVAREEDAREAAKTREFNKDPEAWVRNNMPKKG